MHLRTNHCKGLCLKHYTQFGHSMNNYCSSIVVIESPAPVYQPSISSSLNHLETFAVPTSDDHDGSALSFGDDELVSPKDLRNRLLLLVNYEDRWRSQHDAEQVLPGGTNKELSQRWEDARYTSATEGA